MNLTDALGLGFVLTNPRVSGDEPDLTKSFPFGVNKPPRKRG